MKILLTGHLGFIGSRLYEKLVVDGHEVVGIDIKEGTDILTAELPKVDFVIHLAGIGGVRCGSYCELDPATSTRTLL